MRFRLVFKNRIFDIYHIFCKGLIFNNFLFFFSLQWNWRVWFTKAWCIWRFRHHWHWNKPCFTGTDTRCIFLRSRWTVGTLGSFFPKATISHFLNSATKATWKKDASALWGKEPDQKKKKIGKLMAKFVTSNWWDPYVNDALNLYSHMRAAERKEITI